MSEHTTHQQVALITGVSKGIGRATAEQLAALGMTVVIGARNPRRGGEAAAAVHAAGGDAHAVTLDVTDPTTIQEAARRTCWLAGGGGGMDPSAAPSTSRVGEPAGSPAGLAGSP